LGSKTALQLLIHALIVESEKYLSKRLPVVAQHKPHVSTLHLVIYSSGLASQNE